MPSIKVKCEHGRQRHGCRDCKGAGVCEHGKKRYYCKECKGGAYCEHGRARATCRECKGKAICPHGKVKHNCRECSPGSFCIHNRRKYQCKECGGRGICEHGRQKKQCVDCGGTDVCPHKKLRPSCRECKGSKYCEHDRFRYYCLECKGGGTCEHKKIRSQCKECGGQKLCSHGRQKAHCMECQGSHICVHKKYLSMCRECGGGKSLCKGPMCETTANPRYKGYCLRCCIHLFPDTKVSRNYKTKEQSVVFAVMEAFPDFSWVADKKVVDGCSKKRPDLLLDLGSHIIIVEVDENQHNAYDCSCENKRLMLLSQDLGHRDIVFIRFNPDSYRDMNGKLVKSCWKANQFDVLAVPKEKQKEWEERIRALLTQIGYWVSNAPDRLVEIVELFYTVEKKVPAVVGDTSAASSSSVVDILGDTSDD